VNNIAAHPKLVVSADGTGTVSQAGGVLLTQTLRATGLDQGLATALGRWRPGRAVHDPGKIIADLAAMLALGGDCLADIAMLRAEPALFGPVASDPVVSRLVSRLAADAPQALKAIRAARAAARERAWALAGDAAPGADGALITVDIDATVVTSCSEKDQATPTWKKTFGFHPLTVFADHGPEGSGEPLAFLLRAASATSGSSAAMTAGHSASASGPAGPARTATSPSPSAT
jgi:Transposase DDE domain group 1